MFNKEITHQVFPGFGRTPYQHMFFNDQHVQVHVRNDPNLDLSVDEVLEQLQNGNYVLWVDDVYEPFKGSKSDKHMDKNTNVVVWARSGRTAMEVLDILKLPKTIYFDYELTEVYPRSSGLEPLWELGCMFKRTELCDVKIVPISSNKGYNKIILDDWDKILTDV